MVVEILSEQIAYLLVLAGAALIVGEALAPGAHFMVLGVALLVAGVAGLFLPASLGVVGLFILAFLVLFVGGATLYGYRNFSIYGSKNSGSTSDSEALRGKFGHVTERVTPTDGEIKLDGGGFNPHYQARSVDGEIPEGTEVAVVDPGGGNVLTVEAVETLTDELEHELSRAEREAADAEDEHEPA
jgi:membrane protein implicated in regulation of membrane protease activity